MIPRSKVGAREQTTAISHKKVAVATKNERAKNFTLCFEYSKKFKIKNK